MGIIALGGRFVFVMDVNVMLSSHVLVLVGVMTVTLVYWSAKECHF